MRFNFADDEEVGYQHENEINHHINIDLFDLYKLYMSGELYDTTFTCHVNGRCMFRTVEAATSTNLKRNRKKQSPSTIKMRAHSKKALNQSRSASSCHMIEYIESKAAENCSEGKPEQCEFDGNLKSKLAQRLATGKRMNSGEAQYLNKLSTLLGIDTPSNGMVMGG